MRSVKSMLIPVHWTGERGVSSLLFGGPIAAWGTPCLALLAGAAALDWRAARRKNAPAEPRRLRWAAYLLVALLVAILVGFQALRFTG